VALIVVPVLLASSAAALAQATARDLYTAAVDRENALRSVWQKSASRPATATLKQARSVVADYEAVVREYPRSGYCDNALWQAAKLAADAFTRFLQETDRKKAIALFEFLAREYPTSALAKKAPGEARTLARDVTRPAGTTNESNRTSGNSATRPLSTVQRIRRTVLARSVRVVLDFDRETSYRQQRVENPARLVIDLPSTRVVPALNQALWHYQDAIVRHIRVERQDSQTTRVVLDLEGARSYSVTTLERPFRILVDCQREITDAPAAPKASPGDVVRPPAKPVNPVEPAKTGSPKVDGGSDKNASAGVERPAGAEKSAVPAEMPATSDKAAASADKPAAQPDKAAALPEKTAPPVEKGGTSAVRSAPSTGGKTAAPATSAARSASAARGRVSMARQLGLGVSRIVIDPGHGGHDPGAKGAHGDEADVVLDIALRLEKLLQKSGIEVVLTRHKDVFVPLEERTALANREEADLFLSIHANASLNLDARGVETYLLNFASNPEAEEVAARENAASGGTMSSLQDLVKAIALNNKLDESKDFANLVQDSLVKQLLPANKSLKDLGVKQAPFVVLIGASMPSVLAEVSFITNRREGQLLDTKAYRQRIAKALAEAIQQYRKGLSSAASGSGRQP
jgi:N-acetylmuramoyl-L-alanine amidase